MSAWSIISCGERGTDSSPHTPRLAVAATPPHGDASIAARYRSAACSAPSASVWGSSTQNSSPPYRHTTSPSRASPFSTDATCWSTWSPTLWPCLSLIRLNRSTSAMTHDSLYPYRRAVAHCVSNRAKNDRRLRQPVRGSVVARAWSSWFWRLISSRDWRSISRVVRSCEFFFSMGVTSSKVARAPPIMGPQLTVKVRTSSSPRFRHSATPVRVAPSRSESVQGKFSPPPLLSSACGRVHPNREAGMPVRSPAPCPTELMNTWLARTIRSWLSSTSTPSASVSSIALTRSGMTAAGSRYWSERRR